MKNFYFCAVISTALLLTNTIAATFVGDTTPGNTYNRTTDTGATSDTGNAVGYNAFRVTVSLSGNYTFTAVADDPSNFDTFIHLYTASFDPQNSQDNFLAANDDGFSNPAAGSLLTVSLNSGADYFYVVDGFSNQDYGSYTASVEGPGTATITAVPEPSAIIYSGMGLLGIFFIGRYKRKSANA